jgi:hypothetical protein
MVGDCKWCCLNLAVVKPVVLGGAQPGQMLLPLADVRLVSAWYIWLFLRMSFARKKTGACPRNAGGGQYVLPAGQKRAFPRSVTLQG